MKTQDWSPGDFRLHLDGRRQHGGIASIAELPGASAKPGLRWHRGRENALLELAVDEEQECPWVRVAASAETHQPSRGRREATAGNLRADAATGSYECSGRQHETMCVGPGPGLLRLQERCDGRGGWHVHPPSVHHSADRPLTCNECDPGPLGYHTPPSADLAQRWCGARRSRGEPTSRIAITPVPDVRAMARRERWAGSRAGR